MVIKKTLKWLNKKLEWNNCYLTSWQTKYKHVKHGVWIHVIQNYIYSQVVFSYFEYYNNSLHFLDVTWSIRRDLSKHAWIVTNPNWTTDLTAVHHWISKSTDDHHHIQNDQYVFSDNSTNDDQIKLRYRHFKV